MKATLFSSIRISRFLSVSQILTAQHKTSSAESIQRSTVANYITSRPHPNRPSPPRMSRPSGYKPVPSTREVIPGAHVNIVLKQDQPTGRTVSGAVRDILTRGNHPRGIKVRLADGRVGRVQSIASGPAPQTQEESLQGEYEDTGTRLGGRQRYFSGPSDVRNDAVPTAQVGLDAYIKPAKQRGKGRRNGAAAATDSSAEQSTVAETAGVAPGELATCPVCQDFEGDEAAVAHHVATHFDA